jgi:L-threonylcarbamoyladenylate synthase
MAKKQITKLDLIKILNSGGIGVLPTDTMYGLVGLALNKRTVTEIYKLRYRDFHKPLIVLISSMADLKLLGINVTAAHGLILNKVWPGPVSVILPSSKEKFKHLTRGTKTIAVRLPKNKFLIDIISQTGPLVAPSANLSDYPPAKTIKEAKKYFGNKAAFYISTGTRPIIPSTIIKLTKTGLKVIRPGVVKIKMLR